jgi:hypothetical protein
MVRTVLCLGVLAVGVAGCGVASGRSGIAAAPRAVARSSANAISNSPDSNVARVFHVGRSHGSTRDELAARFGEPDAVRVDTVPNRHGPGTDSLFKLDYGSRIYWVRRPANMDREILELVEIFERNQPLAGGVVVNRTTFEQLRDKLGQPLEGKRSGDTLMVTYRAPGEGADEYVRFDLVKDVVRRVVWIFYVN